MLIASEEPLSFQKVSLMVELYVSASSFKSATISTSEGGVPVVSQ